MTAYFEFYGLPGAGKSTLVEPLIQKLKDAGYRVAGLFDVYGRVPNHWIRLPVLIEILFHISNYSIIYKYWKIHRKSVSPNKHFLKKLIILIHQILMTIQEKKYDIVICDEGIIQYSSSLFYYDSFKGKDLLEEIAQKICSKIDILPIFCSIDLEESLMRMKNRPYGQRRRYSHSVDLPLLEKIMRIKGENLKLIASTFPDSVTIDMKADVNDNIVKLYSLIISKMESCKDSK